MKKTNLALIATIVASFIFATVMFQPSVTEASKNATPNATPSPRRKVPKTIQSPKPIQSPVTRSKQKRRKRWIPAPTPSPVTKQIGVPAPTPSPED